MIDYDNFYTGDMQIFDLDYDDFDEIKNINGVVTLWIIDNFDNKTIIDKVMKYGKNGDIIYTNDIMRDGIKCIYNGSSIVNSSENKMVCMMQGHVKIWHEIPIEVSSQISNPLHYYKYLTNYNIACKCELNYPFIQSINLSPIKHHNILIFLLCGQYEIKEKYKYHIEFQDESTLFILDGYNIVFDKPFISIHT